MTHRDAYGDVEQAVKELTAEQGYPPTYREIASRAELSLSTVHRIVTIMATDGRLMVDGHTARSIRLTSSSNSATSPSN